MQKFFSKTYHFEQLYRENYVRLYYYAFRFITDEEVCKDIVSDVFEKAWWHFEDLKPETATSYLYVQTRNRCIDYLRHRQVEEQYADFYRIVTEEDAGIAPGEMEERVRHIEKFIEQLKDPTKTILKECYFDNKKYQEVAEEFGISIHGIKKHIMKALRLLREEFGNGKVPEKDS